MSLRSLRSIPVVTAAALMLGAAAVPRPAGGRQAVDLGNLEVARAWLAAKVGTSLGPPGGEVRSLVLASGNAERLYLGTLDGHLYHSKDAARSWTLSYADLPADAVIDNLAVHPANDDMVFAAYYRGDGSGGLIRSVDGGASWAALPVPGAPSLRALAISPSHPGTIYVGGLGGIWRTDDGGDSWIGVGDGRKPFEFVESLAVDPRDPERVYAGTWRQAYRTLDGGESWHRIHSGMAIDRDVFSVTIDPRDPDALLVGTCNFIYVSGNGGDGWVELRQGLAEDHNRVHIVAHDPANPEVLYAGTRGALYRSDDTGKSWHIVLSGISVSSIQVSPFGLPVYVGTEERGVLVSRDGLRFEEHNTGLDASRVVAFDVLPGAPRVMFAARSEGTTIDKVLYSTDLGTTWSELGFGPPLGRVSLIRAQVQPINRVLVVAERGWYSVIPGGRWTPVDRPPGTINDLEIAHAAGGEVLAATSTGLYIAQPHELGATDEAARPFGAGAVRIWTPLWEGGAISSLAVNGSRFLAVGSGQATSGDLRPMDSDVAIISSSTGGLPAAVTAVALDEARTGRAYAVSGSDVFRSDDGGNDWRKLQLPWPAADLRAIAIDPNHPDQVLALDFGGALYRGHDGGRHWLILDSDPGLARAWTLRVSAEAPGLALIATQGQGVRVVALDPLENTLQ
jgi:photosystem II stability/assembly factor-like uncharacterized protein